MRRTSSKMVDINEFDEWERVGACAARQHSKKETVVNEENKSFEGWAIIELMGHNMVAGFASEQVIAGTAMLRVDVPEVGEQPAFTKFFGGSAIYAVTPTTQEVATAAAGRLTIRPVQEWVVPTRRQLVDSAACYEEPDDLENEDDFRDEL